MRKVNFKTLLVSGFAAFFLLFLGMNQANAQAGLGESFYDAPAGNFVGSAEAEVILTDQVTVLKNFLATLIPGSPAYKATVRAGAFYRTILQSVVDGKQVPEAISSGTQIFTTAQYGNAPKAEQMGLKAEAIDMLGQ